MNAGCRTLSGPKLSVFGQKQPVANDRFRGGKLWW